MKRLFTSIILSFTLLLSSCAWNSSGQLLDNNGNPVASPTPIPVQIVNQAAPPVINNFVNSNINVIGDNTTTNFTSGAGFITNNGTNAAIAPNSSVLSGTQEAFTTALKNAYDNVVSLFTSGWKTWVEDNLTSMNATIASKGTSNVTLPIAISDVTGLSTNLSSKEPAIAPGLTSQYWRGDKTWQDFNAAVIASGAGTSNGTGLVPYTGANQTVNLGSQNLTANTGTFITVNSTTGRTTSFTVAAPNAPTIVKLQADYVASNPNPETAIKAAIDAARAVGGGHVVLSSGNFTFGSQILEQWSYGQNETIELSGQGDSTVLDLSSLNNSSGGIYWFGSITANVTTLSADGLTGNSTITVTDSSGFSVGDYIRIGSNSTYGMNTIAEITKVKGISGNVITLSEPLSFNYNTANSANITQMGLIPHLVISDIKIVGSQANTNAAGMRITNAINLVIHNVNVYNLGYASFRVDGVVSPHVYDNYSTGSNATGTGYAFAVSLISKYLDYHDNTVENANHSVTIGGGPGMGVVLYSNIHDNYIHNASYGFATHGESKYTTMLNNTVDGTFGSAYSASDDYVSVLYNKAFNVNNDGISSDSAIFVGGSVVTHFTDIGNELHWKAGGTVGQSWGFHVHSDATNLTALNLRDNQYYGFAVNEDTHGHNLSSSISFADFMTQSVLGHWIEIPTQAGWTTNVVSAGIVTQEPMAITLRLNNTGGSTAQAYTQVYGFSTISYAHVDWSKKLAFAFSIARQTDNEGLVGRIQIKPGHTNAALAAQGVGIVIPNLGLYSESYNSASNNTTLGVTMNVNQTYDIVIINDPTIPSCEWWVNDGTGWSMKYLETNSTKIPQTNSGTGVSMTFSFNNGAGATGDSYLYIMNPKLYQVKQ